jgi:maltokinase
MANIDVRKLPEHLKQQRWFGGKEVLIKQASLLDHVVLTSARQGQEGIQVVLAIVQVAYELGSSQRYLLIGRVDPDGQVTDATVDDELARRLLGMILERESISTSGGTIRGEQTHFAKPFLDLVRGPCPIRRMEAEQSNTSLIFGERVILKAIRKLEHGPNPELEMGQFLASRASFRAAPRLLGWIQHEGPITATLAILHQYLNGESNGWKYALDAIKRLGNATPELLDEINTLGKIIAELHLALSSDPDNPAFAPEPIQQADLQRWSASIIGELGVTIAAAAKAIPQLAERRDTLVKRIQLLARLPPSGKKIRIHGDLHLGQVLRTDEGWMVLDFEGEPTRNFNQRRDKYSPLRDVAGMLRSFAYAGAVIELEGGTCGDCVPRCRNAFLEGYLSIAHRTDLLPSSQHDFAVILDVMEIERLLYEIRYELLNRPEWVRIPARALMQPED